MNLNPMGLAGTILALVLFFATLRGLRVATRPRKVRTLALSLPASVPGLWFAAYYVHVIPEWSGFYELRSWPGSELLVALPGLSAGALASMLSRWTRPVLGLGVVAGAIAPFLKPVVSPLRDADLADHWNGEVCLQSTGSTCGPASVCTILKHLGIQVSERELAREAFSSFSGTEAWYLARAVRRRGCEACFDFGSELPGPDGLPAMIGVRLGAGHFIAVLSYQGGRFLTADPLAGPASFTPEEFRARYSLSGFRMLVRSNLHP